MKSILPLIPVSIIEAVVDRWGSWPATITSSSRLFRMFIQVSGLSNGAMPSINFNPFVGFKWLARIWAVCLERRSSLWKMQVTLIRPEKARIEAIFSVSFTPISDNGLIESVVLESALPWRIR